MTMTENPYTAGYEAAYREIYASLNDGEHAICGECRPCGVVYEIGEILVETLANRLSQDEFFGLAVLLTQTNTSVKDLNGKVPLVLGYILCKMDAKYPKTKRYHNLH